MCADAVARRYSRRRKGSRTTGRLGGGLHDVSDAPEAGTQNLRAGRRRPALGKVLVEIQERVMKPAMALLAAMLLVSAPASAQVDFSGEWAPRFWEDQI